MEDNQEPMPKLHHLKTLPHFFKLTADGIKTFEYRKNDRDFNSGDILILKEYNPDKETYSGKFLIAIVGLIIYGGQVGIPEDYVVMGIRVL